MANKLKKSNTPKTAVAGPGKTEKPEKPAREKTSKAASSQKFKADKEEKVDLKKLARDERTWKIVGTVSLLISIFLFLAFISYFFTWKEDQDELSKASFLTNNETKVANLLGRLGAYLSDFFIYRGFGIASLLFCTFFFL